MPSAGTYRVTIVYDPDDEHTRTGRINDIAFTFAGGEGCCLEVAVTVPLSPGGTLTIAPTNWIWQPAIDRIRVEPI